MILFIFSRQKHSTIMTNSAPVREVFANFTHDALLKSLPDETVLASQISNACLHAFPSDAEWQCDDEALIVLTILRVLALDSKSAELTKLLGPVTAGKTAESVLTAVCDGVHEALICIKEEERNEYKASAE